MPTYEYACKGCGQNLEVVQSFSDEPLTECSACGGQLRKVFGNVGIAFKGSGFYKNDSRGSSKATPSSSTTNESSAEGDSSAKKDSPAKKDDKSAATPAAAASGNTSASTTSTASE